MLVASIIVLAFTNLKKSASIKTLNEDTHSLNQQIEELKQNTQSLETNNVELNAEIERLKKEIKVYSANKNTYIGTFTSTAYCTEDWRGTGIPHSCNSGNPKKGALGEDVIPYQTVAVDPSVIPLGSNLMIVDEYGNTYHVRANDTGGSIKGNRIDMVCNSHSEAEQWGRRTVKIWIKN